ncbi:hypothetical protein RB195_010573 [Necator americanus]|uniref:Tc1-like transposase DDE domain-containing protein n=1 Tax=Necator americanus TaxID=51031 RepID=A0ABR1CZN4_NECAM
MTTEFLMPKLEEIDVEDMRFQQDGATCHTARETGQLLHERFPGRVLSLVSVIDERVRMCQQSRGGHLPDVVFHNPLYAMFFMLQ